MPTITPGSKVLVSGANGYIAIWVVRTLLERGYAVRGTVRSAEKGRFLSELFKSYGDKFEIAVVEDITKDGAFDEAVKGVDAIEHLASPFHLNADDPQEIIGPAVKGTVGILHSVLKNAPGVKRIVVTSSCAAVLTISKEPRIFTEENWNEQATKEIEEKGRNAMNISKYRASKTLAERAAWDFHKENKSKINWDLVVINPPFVFGPAIHDAPTINSLSTSSHQFYDAVLVEGFKTNEALATEGSCWVDVRDLGEGHVRALEKEAAGGERIIISAGPYVWQDWVDVANSLSPSPIPSHKSLPRGNPGGGKNAIHLIQYNTEKEGKILGLKYRSKEETTRDTLADFEARGW
ncbi:hypothetical protein BDZ94DRAFT_1273374 [Collybia nuda]|uniref:NAD-dependent epimerase/dehydratase domain-containing protein n=1 Tax=Collybia nuda TaxID=64659 RepID=A0A9P5XV31_9AGAR|nr:hypothetical protein BDZ94DRAFT_1273374 [Collybia nuda]